MRAERLLHLIKGNDTTPLPPARPERRDFARRTRVVQQLMRSVVADPYSAVTVDILRDGLDVPPDAARRLLLKLARARLLEKGHNGVWVRTNRAPDRSLVL